MIQTLQQDLERVFINKFCGSFKKDFQKVLNDIGFYFTVEVVEPIGVLKLVMLCHTQEEYWTLKHKHPALRYRVKNLVPTVQKLLIVCLPWSERIPTKHEGVYVREIYGVTFPCLVVDIKSGENAETTVDDRVLGGKLTQEQTKALFAGLFGENNLKGGQI